jgi:hypothetical protein
MIVVLVDKASLIHDNQSVLSAAVKQLFHQ